MCQADVRGLVWLNTTLGLKRITMTSLRIITPQLLLMIALILSTGGYAGAEDYLDRLMEACSAGNKKACEEIEQMAEANKNQLEKLNQRARFFQSQSSHLAIQGGTIPDLNKAYPIIVKDYFASDAIGPSHRKRGFTERLLNKCSQQFHGVWINQKKEWPTLPSGQPDWSTIYFQVLDHYFRFCSK